MKSGFWQIQIHPKDRYKTAFTVPFGQYEWTVTPFDLKNAPSEFQRIMNDIYRADLPNVVFDSRKQKVGQHIFLFR